MSWRALWGSAALVVGLICLAGCSSDEASQEEQSKAQSEVLSEHFSAKRPESRESK